MSGVANPDTPWRDGTLPPTIPRAKVLAELQLVPAHLCQLCARPLDLTDRPGRDGLCPDCDQLLLLDDQAAWTEAGGRLCRRCRRELTPAMLLDGLCPCGGAPL